MKKDVKPYKQKGDTCAIVCLLMVLEYYKIINKINWYDERRLYNIYKSKYMIGTPFGAIAYHLAKNKLETHIYHSNEEIFINNNSMQEDIFNNALKEYEEYLLWAKEKGCNIINGIEINTKIIKEELEKDYLIILAGQIYNDYHAILVIGYENSNFIVCDPLCKTQQIKTEKELESFMNTNIGKWFVKVKR